MNNTADIRTNNKQRVQMKGAKVIPLSKCICARVLGAALSSREYSYSDILYFISIACSEDIPDTQLAMLSTLLSRCTYSGTFSLTFNQAMREAIKTRNTATVKQLVMSGQNVYVELFDNPLLSENERLAVYNTYVHEYSAMFSLIHESENISCDEDIFSFNGPYTQCYSEVCMMTSTESTPPSHTVYVEDNSQHPDRLYCIDILDLARILANNSPNPYTGSKFPPELYKNLSVQYSKEIKMYQCFSRG